MYQGMTEAEKESFSLDLMQLEQLFCRGFDFDYDSSDNWEKEYIYEKLFWPLLKTGFEWDSSEIEVWLIDLRDVSYSAEDAGWTVDAVAEFESKLEILAEKALEESKIYRIEWED